MELVAGTDVDREINSRPSVLNDAGIGVYYTHFYFSKFSIRKWKHILYVEITEHRSWVNTDGILEICSAHSEDTLLGKEFINAV